MNEDSILIQNSSTEDIDTTYFDRYFQNKYETSAKEQTLSRSELLASIKEAVGVLEESPDALLLLLLSPTIEKPSPNELKFPTEIRSLLMIRRSVIGGQWHIMTMLRLMSENRYKASDTRHPIRQLRRFLPIPGLNRSRPI